jgi:hypothetical protein
VNDSFGLGNKVGSELMGGRYKQRAINVELQRSFQNGESQDNQWTVVAEEIESKACWIKF